MTLPAGPTLSTRTLPWHTDWAAIFGADRPLIVEIGFGRGAFLRHLAGAHRDHNIVGIEIANQCLESAERMIAREGLFNVRVVHSMAETALHHLFTSGSISAIHINFPDPWFKSDHQHRRLMQPATAALIADRLAPDGMLWLATDIAEYADMSDAVLSGTRGLVNTLPARWLHSLPGRVVTKYEATARREGRMCYYFAYRRDHTPLDPIPVQREWDMPHAVIHTPVSLSEMHARFEPLRAAEDGIHVHLSEAFLGRAGLLIEAHIGEPTIRQHLMLGIYHYGDGTTPDTYTVQLANIGQPRATRGTHIAVRALRDWVLALHPDGRALHEKLQSS